MKPHWLLEKDVFRENLDRMVAEIHRQGMICKVVDYVPFSGGRDYLGSFNEHDCVVFYGCIQFARQIQREAKWIPSLYATFKNYDCSVYYPALGSTLLARNYVMLPFGDLPRQKEFLFRTVGRDDQVFLRPCASDKIFTGQVVCKEKFDYALTRLSMETIEPNEMVVAAEPQDITHEYRFVIVNGRAVTGTQSHENRELEVVPLAQSKFGAVAMELAQQVAEGPYRPDAAWCLDVCIVDGKAFVLEVGAFSCAGLYDCEMDKVVEAVSAAAMKDWEDVNKV